MLLNGRPFDVDALVAKLQQRAEITRAFNPQNKWDYIRLAYQFAMPDIMTHERIDPYVLDWVRHFTPIERLIWPDIRGIGVPMYPQFPALNYFIDFANPRKKIGIEADGAAWHDRDKDTRRDRRLAEHGWKIFRVTGSECYRTRERPQPDEDSGEIDMRKLEDWYMHTSEGVVQAINDVYFDFNPYKNACLAIRTLRVHKLADFEVCPEVSPFPEERPAPAYNQKGGID